MHHVFHFGVMLAPQVRGRFHLRTKVILHYKDGKDRTLDAKYTHTRKAAVRGRYLVLSVVAGHKKGRIQSIDNLDYVITHTSRNACPIDLCCMSRRR